MSATFAAIVLAGGFSTRMNSFKPLLPLGESTVTSHVIDTFLSAGVDVLLVVGHRREEIKASIKKKDITIIYNSAYRQGMFSSIQAGVRRLQPTHQAFFVLPVDIPLVRPATIRLLMGAAIRSPDNVIYPVFGGRRGHPPLVPATLAHAILGWAEGGGLKAVLAKSEKPAAEVPVADGCILFDIDTPEDYRQLLERFDRYELPTDQERDEILKLCRVPPDRAAHSLKVAGAAGAIARALKASGLNVDEDLVHSAAILHDIAKGQPKHDIAGGRALREMGFGKVGDVVAVHSDLAGGNIGLPLESKIVYLADKLVAGERLVFLEERYGEAGRRFRTPAAEAAIAARLQVARGVKKELEDLIGGRPLEDVVSAEL
jgi:molybdenum cofactor cytidylyltransferase